MSVSFEDRLNAELQAAHARLKAPPRRRHVLVPALAVAVVVVACVLLARSGGAPRERSAVGHGHAPATGVLFKAGRPATVSRRDELRVKVRRNVDHVRVVPAPANAPVGDWLVGRTAGSICFASDTSAACGSLSTFAARGLVVTGSAAAGVGTGSAVDNDLAQGILPTTFRSVEVVDTAGHVLARSGVTDQAFAITVTGLTAAAHVLAVRADNSKLELTTLGPVPSSSTTAAATSGSALVEQHAAELLPAFARPRDAGDALPQSAIDQLPPSADASRARRVSTHPVWLVPQNLGGLLLVRPDFSGGTPLTILRKQGFTPTLGYNTSTGPTLAGPVLDSVRRVTVIRADGTPVVVRNRDNLIFWNQRADQLPQAVRWRGPDGRRHRLSF